MEALNRTASTVVDDGRNIGFSILMQFSDARREVDLEIRKLITVFCHVFRQHKAPPTPIAYFHATCSSLDLIAATPKPLPSADVIRAHFTILSFVITKVPAAFLVHNLKTVCDSISPVLRIVSPMMSHDAASCVGINCIAQLFTTATNGVHHWSQVSEVFRFFLGYANGRMNSFKVREHARLCVRDTLRSLEASKDIMDLLMNKYPMRQTTSDSDECVSLKAKDTFDLVILCLGIMPAEDTTAALVYFKQLLELHHTNVTTLITDGLYRLCQNPSLPDVPLELLLDLICSICVSISQHKTKYSVKPLAGLLKLGVPKIYSLNKQICITKLLMVFEALVVLLKESEVVMDIIHAGNALKCLISLIDESLIKQGVKPTLMKANMNDGSRFNPILIEKLCATFHKLLSYSAAWHIVSEIISTMFDKLGIYSSYLMRVVVKTLADMQKLPDKTFRDKVEVKLLLEIAVEKCGLDAVAAVLPQEHMELLAEINQQRGSKSAVVSSCILKATTCGDNLSQSKDTNNGYFYSDLAYKTMLNHKRKKAGKKSLSDHQWRKFLERLAKRRAEDAISSGLGGAARMTKKLKL